MMIINTCKYFKDNVFKDAPLHYESVLVAKDLMARRGLFHECEKKK